MSQPVVNATMSLHAHIKELRTRLFVVAFIFIVASMLAYVFRDVVIAILLAPLDGQQLSYLTLGGGFNFIFNVIMWSGVAVSVPFFIYAMYGFIAPALPERAQKKSLTVLVSSFFLLCCGATFGYVYAIPGAIRFLLTFAGAYVNPMLTADAYLSFVLVYTIGLGVLFQIPLIMIIINWITPLGPKKLFSIERYVIVGAFIIAAFITPTPDAINQSIIAAPIIIMYQIGFIGVLISRRSRRLEAVSESPATVQLAESMNPAQTQAVAVPQSVVTQPVILGSTTGSVRAPSVYSRRDRVIAPPARVVRSIDGVSPRPRSRRIVSM